MKKIIVILFFLGSYSMTFGQKWGGGVDDERYHFGFAFQYISSELKLLKKPDWRAPYFDQETGLYVTDPLTAISSQPSPGFGVGLVFNYRLNSHSDIRITPTLIFNDRNLSYQYQQPAVNNKDFSFVKKGIESTLAEIPFSYKLKSDRRKNFRAYLLAGGKLSLDIASKRKSEDVNRSILYKFVKGERQYLSYEGGLGFDFYFENFKLSPELKMSYSFRDVLIHDNTPFSSPIEKAKLRQFTFSLFIE